MPIVAVKYFLAHLNSNWPVGMRNISVTYLFKRVKLCILAKSVRRFLSIPL